MSDEDIEGDEMDGHPVIPECVSRAAQIEAGRMLAYESERLGEDSDEQADERWTAALTEFRLASRLAHSAQLAAQEAAKRYAAAVKRMSELAVAESER